MKGQMSETGGGIALAVMVGLIILQPLLWGWCLFVWADLLGIIPEEVYYIEGETAWQWQENKWEWVEVEPGISPPDEDGYFRLEILLFQPRRLERISEDKLEEMDIPLFLDNL